MMASDVWCKIPRKSTHMSAREEFEFLSFRIVKNLTPLKFVKPRGAAPIPFTTSVEVPPDSHLILRRNRARLPHTTIVSRYTNKGSPVEPDVCANARRLFGMVSLSVFLFLKPLWMSALVKIGSCFRALILLTRRDRIDIASGRVFQKGMCFAESNMLRIFTSWIFSIAEGERCSVCSRIRLSICVRTSVCCV